MTKGYVISIAIVGFAAALAVATISYFETLKSMDLHGHHEYAEYITKHGKSYGTKEEYLYRKELYDKAVKEINAINSQNNVTYHLAVNKFADWTESEKKNLFGLRFPEGYRVEDQEYHLLNSTSNGPVDWRGKMNGIKNQGNCGSCWAFSAIGAIEAHHNIKTGQLLQLSEQQLVDCSWGQGNHGCSGGLYTGAFTYSYYYGTTTAALYPYTGVNGQCHGAQGAARVIQYYNVQAYSSNQLAAALNQGPVSVSVEAAGSTFLYYKGGIINGNCGTKLDHAIVAVGWGTENGVNYWLVRNSWGAGWGESGYARIAITDGVGICGILSGPPSWPVTQ